MPQVKTEKKPGPGGTTSGKTRGKGARMATGGGGTRSLEARSPKSLREKKKKKKKAGKKSIDPHLLYQASVQCVEADLDFVDKVYKKRNGSKPALLREDFCGTAWLACEWVRRRKTNRALGVDLHEPTLEWGRTHNLSSLEPEQLARLELVRDDVRNLTRPPVDVVMALNFSYYIFKTRDGLREYFKQVRKSLRPGGLLVADAFGGTEAMTADTEDRSIDSSRAPDGTRIPAFTYTWEQADFNVVNHDILCHIHFKVPGHKKMKKAYSYDWRLWTLPEITEIMVEAGFASGEVYLDTWDDDAEEADGVYKKRSYYENMAGWIAYVVGVS